VRNESPWAFIKFSFERFLFLLHVLDVWCIWSFAHADLTVCQRLFTPQEFISLPFIFWWFLKPHGNSLLKMVLCWWPLGFPCPSLLCGGIASFTCCL
jgi:hypothetical protein